MLCQVLRIRIGAACQPCTGREGLAELAINEDVFTLEKCTHWQLVGPTPTPRVAIATIAVKTVIVFGDLYGSRPLNSTG